MIFRIRGLPANGVLTSASGPTQGENITASMLPFLIPTGTRQYIYKTNAFWAGNDSVSFDVADVTAFRSAIAVDTLIMLPVLYPPELNLIYYTPIVSDIRTNAYFQIEIISHSEPYFDYLTTIYPGCDTYQLYLQFANPSDFSVTMPTDATSYFNQQTDGAEFLSNIFPVDGTKDSPIMDAQGKLFELRYLMYAADPNNPTSTAGQPYMNVVVTQPGIIGDVIVIICQYNPNSEDGMCPHTPDPGVAPTGPDPVWVTRFSLEYSGGTGNEVSSTLPVPALVFVWIGIGLVALACYGCLFWRWWKNRRLQQRTRTNMAAGANASKYLHSL